MSNCLIPTQSVKTITTKNPRKSKTAQKTKPKKVAAAKKCLTEIHLKKVKELQEKLESLTKLLKNGRKHPGIELLAISTKKRLARAKELCKLDNALHVDSVPGHQHVENVETQTDDTDDHFIRRCWSRRNPNQSLSKDYGNYYSMRLNILHMENHKQALIESKGLQEFLFEYQKKLAKCFKFEQSQFVQDQFATDRINKLSDNSIDFTPSKTVKSSDSMSEVTMEKDLVTLVSSDPSVSLHSFDDDDRNIMSGETNFLDQFLKDKVMEFLYAAATNEFASPSFPLAESVSDSRLENLMAFETKVNRSAASVNDNFTNISVAKFRGKCSNIIPIKHGTATTNIRKLLK